MGRGMGNFLGGLKYDIVLSTWLQRSYGDMHVTKYIQWQHPRLIGPKADDLGTTFKVSAPVFLAGASEW